MGRIVAVVPARGGSKGISDKNIKYICGHPLIYWALNAADKSQFVTDVVLATDSDRIKSVAQKLKIERLTIYDRDPANATDTSSTEDFLIEYALASNFDPHDILILLQATSPLTSTAQLDKAMEQFRKEGLDSLLTCIRTKRFLWNESGQSINYDFCNRPRRQDFSGTLMENGAFYIFSVGGLLKYRNRLHGKIGIYEMPSYSEIEIDEPDDWPLVERAMKKVLGPISSAKSIKLFISDVDGTLTDAGMYYDELGNEFKKFSTYDGKGFELLRNAGIKTGIITSENTKIVERRAKKLQVDFLHQGVSHSEKLLCIQNICKVMNISLSEVAYIGDDINCLEALKSVGMAACPINARPEIKCLPNITQLSTAGGHGAVRDFIDIILA